MRKQIASLGLFKGKEKRALQDKIDQVSADITEKKQVEEETKQQLQEEIEANKQRISKIDAEFRKPRGRIATKEKSIAIKDAVIDGKFAITPEQFVDYMRDVIPKPYYLEPALKIVGTHMGNRLGLEKQYQIGIHDSSVKRSDGNDNTGCVIFIQADSPTDKIQSISLEGSQDLTDETAQMWCKLGSNLSKHSRIFQIVKNLLITIITIKRQYGLQIMLSNHLLLIRLLSLRLVSWKESIWQHY